MMIFDTVTHIVKHYQPTVDFLKNYYANHEQHYEEYFRYHCHHVE
ncbi:hypothetical protein [Lysinibacillus sp. ZYM-1]|nr:hypothetical protein [Lysinibacillus sp. ZYM-1]